MEIDSWDKINITWCTIRKIQILIISQIVSLDNKDAVELDIFRRKNKLHEDDQ